MKGQEHFSVPSLSAYYSCSIQIYFLKQRIKLGLMNFTKKLSNHNSTSLLYFFCYYFQGKYYFSPERNMGVSHLHTHDSTI